MPAQAAAGGVDPLQWWGALTQQFQTIANAAIKDAAARTPEMPAIKASAEQASDLFSQAIKSSTEAWSEAVKTSNRSASNPHQAAPARQAPTKKAAQKVPPKSAIKAPPKAASKTASRVVRQAASKSTTKAAQKTIKPAASPAAKRAR
jgi:hypothetical protein